MDSPNEIVVLPDGYHLDNFERLLDHAQSVYKDLLLPTEIEWINRFQALHSHAQSLYVRLVMRKGPFFRTDNLKYNDIPDIDEAVKALAGAELVTLLPTHHLEGILNLCLKAELQTIAKTVGTISVKLSKPDLIQALLDQLTEDQLQTAIIPLFTWIERNHDDVVRRLELLFFANARQSLTEFITQQLGIVEYEQYPIDGKYRFFQTRQRLELLEQLALISDWREFELKAASADDIENVLQRLLSIKTASENHDAYIERKTLRMMTQVTRQLERVCPDKALNYYPLSNFPPSRERQARILTQQKQFKDAHQLISDIETHPEHPDEFDKLLPLKKKVCKALNESIGPPSPRRYLEKHLTLTQDACSIEHQVAQYLSDDQHECFHLENHLFLGLFGLFFWDIIFSPRQDAFYNSYQFGPRDLWEPDFYLQRKDAIDARLLELDDTDTWHQRMLSTAVAKQGIANYFVTWQIWNEALITRLCSSLNGTHLAAIFKQMLQHLGYFRNGFPDLVLLTDSGYHLWEVKGPTDSLQPNQKRWLNFFQDHHIPAGVIYVEWQPE